MQIVIDIPESILNTIQADEMISREQLAVLQMHILNGTHLPQGHGRLIDANNKIEVDTGTTFDWIVGATARKEYTIDYLIKKAGCEVPTIVEADKEIEDADNN